MNVVVQKQDHEIFVSGSVDSTNAPSFERQLLEAREAETDTFSLNLKNLSYISSAGLRVFLKLAKSGTKLSLVDVSPLVYENLEISGFTSFLEVRKALREISVENCEELGHGSYSRVYVYDNDTVVKVYEPSIPYEFAKKEQMMAKAAFSLGMPTVMPFEIVTVGKQFAVMTERVKGKSLSSIIAENGGDGSPYLKAFMELMKHVNSITDEHGTLPDVKDIFMGTMRRCGRTDEQLAKYQKLLDAIPNTNTILHGDLHPGNLMYSKGQYWVLDIETLCHGHPLFEISSFALAAARYLDLVSFLGKDFVPFLQTILGVNFGMKRYEDAHEFFDKGIEIYAPAIKDLSIEEQDELKEMLRYFLLLRTVQRMSEFPHDFPIYIAYKVKLEPYAEDQLFSNSDRFIALLQKYEHLFR